MNIEQVKTIVVIGTGAMGQQIAVNVALDGHTNGYQVILCDLFLGVVEKAQRWAANYLSGRVAKGHTTQFEAGRISASLSFSQDVDEAAARADIVIEAIIEDLETKRELSGRISKPYRPDTVLGTNSFNLVSSKLIDVTQNPQRLLNIHYFNPVSVTQLVELVRGLRTTPEAIGTVKAFAANIEKAPIVINREISGSVANRINAAVTYEACSLPEKGIASVEDIDTACEKGLGHPMGPFRPMDLTGINADYYMRRGRYAESGDEYDKLNPLVIEKFQKSESGRKTGKGWCNYSTADKK